MTKVGHTVWLPGNLDVLVRNHAAALGMGFNNIVIDALHQKFGLDRDPLSELMQELRMWLLSKYSRTSFPPDVILQTFLHIHATPKLLNRYQQIVQEGMAEGASHLSQASLNRRIGQAIHSVLGGHVSKRKLPSSGCPLIKMFSELSPGTKQDV